MSLLDEFLDSRDLAETTVKSYKHHLAQYSNFIGKSLDELIEEAEFEEEEGVKLRNTKLKHYLTRYRKQLEKEDKSPKNIRLSMTIIRTFYNEFEIRLPPMRKNKKYTKNAENIKLLPTANEIRKAVNMANIKYKAIILLMVSSGMASLETRNLTYIDFLEAINGYLEGRNLINPLDINELSSRLQGKVIVPEWTVKRQKTGNFYYTFSSPESTNAILNYLEDHPPQNLENHLFRTANGGFISDITFNTYFKRINDRCNFGKTGRWSHFRSHNLRKIFTSTLYAAGLPQLTIDWMLGHQINPVTEAYFKADPTKLRLEYLKVVDKLTFIEKIKLEPVTSPEYDQLLKKNQEIEKQNQQMEERMEKMDNLIQELMKKQLNKE